MIMSKLCQNTTTFLTTFLYNHVNIPSSTMLKCSCCGNNEMEKHLQQQLGNKYFPIPDRYVDIFVCNFCKKLDQPKCIYCWQMIPCCEHKEKVLYKEYFASLKKEILSCSGNLIKAIKKYDNPSQQFTPSSQIFTKLISALSKVQQQLKQQIGDNIKRKNQKVVEKYKVFEKGFLQRLKVGIDRNEMNLVSWCRVIEEMDGFRRQLQVYGWKEVDKYLQRVGEYYRVGLFNRINGQLRSILTPQITYNSSLTQTIQRSDNLFSPISSGDNINPFSQINHLSQKVKSLQKQLSQSIKIIQLREMEIRSLSNKITLLMGGVNGRLGEDQGNDQMIMKKQQQSINAMKVSKKQHQITVSKPLRKEPRRQIDTLQSTTNRQKSSSWLEDVVKQMAE